MYPYESLGFFSFIGTLLMRFFSFLSGQLLQGDLVTEDLQFLSLIISGALGVIVGFFLIYNRLTMVANSLSHTLLLGLVVSFLAFRSLGVIFKIDELPFFLIVASSLLTTFLTTGLIYFLSKRISQEASNAFSFTALFALGILISSSYLKNTHLGLESVTGDLEAISMSDVKALFFTFLAVFGFCFIFMKKLVLTSFDPFFAKSIQINSEGYRFILILLASFALMVCFRSLGVILVLNLLTAPVLSLRLFFHERKKIFFGSIAFVFIQAFLCLAIVQYLFVDHNIPISTSGLYGFLGLALYLISLSIKKSLDSRQRG